MSSSQRAFWFIDGYLTFSLYKLVEHTICTAAARWVAPIAVAKCRHGEPSSPLLLRLAAVISTLLRSFAAPSPRLYLRLLATLRWPLQALRRCALRHCTTTACTGMRWHLAALGGAATVAAGGERGVWEGAFETGIASFAAAPLAGRRRRAITVFLLAGRHLVGAGIRCVR